jgi:Xaa-Pro dipeptidase
MSSRIEKLSHISGVEAILIASPPSIKYFTGISFESYERPIILYYNDGETSTIVPKLERGRTKDVPDNIIYYDDGENPWVIAKNLLEDAFSKAKKVGVEHSLPHNIFKLITRSVGTKRITDISPYITELRAVKTRDEIELIRKAAEIIERIYSWIEDNVSVGMNERDVSLDVIRVGESLGADNVVFAAVQSGPNSSIPHHERSGRTISPDDVIVIDVALSYQGYYADLTRVFIAGKPMKDVAYKYSFLEDIVSKAVQEGGKGILASSLDRFVRRELKKKGLLEYFIHRTGHGLGVEVHEPPYISPDSKDMLREGMVFTIEPGIYFPGRYGLRLETDVLVSEDGLVPLDSCRWQIRNLGK